ncbi:MAG: lipid-binding SYLF domain-containing protein [Pyrinomonadaceae bacterium]|jgi:lipid-binding SYLF domain-containing protein
MKFTIKRFAILLGLMIAVTAPALSGYGQTPSAKQLKEAKKRSEKAAKTIHEIMRIAEKSIPQDLLAKAKAVVVFPGSLKLSFIVGGQGGSGVAISRLAKGWSAPAFLNMGGGSIGPQIGGQSTDYVLLIMNDEGLKKLLQDKFEIGGEGSVAAGPVGRTAAASTNARMDAEILTYSRSKGLFAGVALKGIVITQDESLNRALYDKSAKQILVDNPVLWSDAPEAVRAFPIMVNRYAR